MPVKQVDLVYLLNSSQSILKILSFNKWSIRNVQTCIIIAILLNELAIYDTDDLIHFVLHEEFFTDGSGIYHNVADKLP